jgi:DNA-binding response OmpR family regulator
MKTPAGERAAQARAVQRRWVASTGLVLLVADPDTSDRERLVRDLHDNGVETVWCHDGASALVAYGRVKPHAVLVSPSLEMVDAATVVCAIRSEATLPILVPIGPDDTQAAGPVLVAGATAVTRPCQTRELVRHIEGSIPDLAARARLRYGPLELDPRAYSVHLDGQELEDLPLKEFELLRILMTYADQVVTTEQISCAIWGDASRPPSPNTIAVHVARLRARLGDPTAIKRIRGRGYRLTFPTAQVASLMSNSPVGACPEGVQP